MLAEGQVTGHAHAVEEHDARTFTHDGERYLLTRSKAQLIHEEHAPIAVPPGAYRIVIQREYAPDPIRSVGTGETIRVLDSALGRHGAWAPLTPHRSDAGRSC